MPESFKSRRFRWMFNFFPAYRGPAGDSFMLRTILTRSG